MRYEEIPLAPAFVHRLCLSCFAPCFVQAVIPGLPWPRYLVFSAGQTDAGPCGRATASCLGGAAMVELLLKKITYWEEKTHFLLCSVYLNKQMPVFKPNSDSKLEY